MRFQPAKNIALFLSFIALSLIISMPAYCWDRDDNIEKAVRDFKGSYQESGMSLMRSQVSSCYKSALKTKNKKKFEYCAAYDLSAYFLDNQMAQQLNYPPFEGFDLDTASKRIESGLIKLGYSEQQRKSEAKFIGETTAKWFNTVLRTD
ncbi:MAG TPA: hypothetical protein PK263_05420 [bacterium]|jgi:hypothetical protein|nr:hypothetical protein [Deltaproteobacteria bacterium]HOE33880.1 hypothetical protein [Smithella sp.]HOX41600.1 hypothetical protein [bacterium]